jgi:hypothetical protein
MQHNSSSDAVASKGVCPQVDTYYDIRDQRYRTEIDIGTSDIRLKRAEYDIISDIGINF